MLEITKEEVLQELGNYITTSNMQTSSGGSASNQFKIFYENAVVFQSYSSLIAIKFNDKVSEKFKGKVVICSDYKYSNTTSKYRCAFLGEKIKDTDKKIENETYLYCSEL